MGYAPRPMKPSVRVMSESGVERPPICCEQSTVAVPDDDVSSRYSWVCVDCEHVEEGRGSRPAGRDVRHGWWWMLRAWLRKVWPDESNFIRPLREQAYPRPDLPVPPLPQVGAGTGIWSPPPVPRPVSRPQAQRPAPPTIHRGGVSVLK